MSKKDNDLDELRAMMKQPSKRAEETHVRTTFLLEQELSKRLDRLATGKRGFKSMFFNKAVKKLLDELEE